MGTHTERAQPARIDFPRPPGLRGIIHLDRGGYTHKEQSNEPFGSRARRGREHHHLQRGHRQGEHHLTARVPTIRARPAVGAARRRAWPPPRPGREEGSLSLELVVLLPVLFTLLFLGTQIALFYQARSVAIAAAADGARTAGGENATAADGEAAAWSFIAAPAAMTLCRRPRSAPSAPPPRPASRSAVSPTA